MVMNCVMFAWFVSTPLFKDMSSADLKSMLYAEKQKEIEDDIVPIGIIDSGKRYRFLYRRWRFMDSSR